MGKVFMLANCSDLAEHLQVAPVSAFDQRQIARLMVDAYEGTTDWDDGDDENVALAEIEATVQGKYGKFDEQASGVIADSSGNPVAAIIVSFFENRPTILFVFTGKDHLRQGYASALIRNAANVLLQRGIPEIALFVSLDNPARLLYRRLGFKEQS